MLVSSSAQMRGEEVRDGARRCVACRPDGRSRGRHSRRFRTTTFFCRSRSAVTNCSLSPIGTRGSRVPCAISTGARMRSMRWIGEMRANSSASRSGSPYSAARWLRRHAPVPASSVVEIGDAVVVHRGAPQLGMLGDRRHHHEAAVRLAHDADALAVDRRMRGQPVPAVREIGHAVEPPFDIVALGIGAAVAGAAAHIRQQHGEALREQHLDVGPEIRPRLADRPAMHPHDRRIAAGRAADRAATRASRELRVPSKLVPRHQFADRRSRQDRVAIRAAIRRARRRRATARATAVRSARRH